jgi:cytoskeleton protein RodZ
MTDSGAATGLRLKAERERRGLSSQKAADELHLDGWIIDALEAEDYLRIGPSVYAKGHLKRYAALLGLPAAEIMAGYESRAQGPAAPASQPANVRLRTDEAPAANVPWLRIGGVALLALLALGVFWWKPWQQLRTAPAPVESVAANSGAVTPDGTAGSAGAPASASELSAVPSATPPTMPAPPPAAAPAMSHAMSAGMAPAVGPSAMSAAAAMPAAQSAPADPDAVAGAGRARLRLSFSADSWVDVHDAAGRRAFAGNGRANSVKTIAGVAPMRVYLGFASGVQLEINNRAVAIGPQFLAGDVARFEAGADGVLRRDSHPAPAPAMTAPGTQTRNAHPTG